VIKIRPWLENARTEKRLTKASLAGLVNIDATTIGKYERGERRPSVETAKKIATALNFDWTLFFQDEQPEDSLKEEAI